MSLIKRWAFVPLLAYLCVIVGVALSQGAHVPTSVGYLVGGLLTLPAAAFVDHRRQVQRQRGLRPW